MSTPAARIPLFPLHTVLFPGGLLPLQIFEPRYLDLVRNCVRSGEGFGVVTIREGREAGGPAVPWPLGTLAHIEDWSQGQNGLLNILVRGGQRFEVSTSHAGEQGLLHGEVTWREDVCSVAPDSDFTELRALLEKIVEQGHASIQREAVPTLRNAEIVWRIVELMPLPVSEKLGFLGAIDDSSLLRDVTAVLAGVLQRGPLN